MVTPIVSVAVFLVLLTQAAAASQPISAIPGRTAAETPWPYVVHSGQERLLVYQPQVASWDGFRLSASAAVSVTEHDEQHPAFGTLRITAWTLVDKDTRRITLDQYSVDVAIFSGVPAARANEWLAALRSDAATVPKTIGLDRLEAALEVRHAAEKSASQPLGNEPPAIILSTTPAKLVSLDGPPIYRDIGSLSYQRVINTRTLLLKATNGRHYLYLRDGWLTAASLTGTWAALSPPPAGLDIVSRPLRDDLESDPSSDPLAVTARARSLAAAAAPAIYIVTRATELIVTQGAPQWIPIPDTQLAFAANTSGDLFESLREQKIYALVSGRWFRAAGAQGPWEFVRADQLPSDFTRIPDDSPKVSVKASVAGTPQAREAVVANDIPQTAAITIGGTRMPPPQFDGIPRLAPIARTSLQYVINVSTPVIQVNATTYYALEAGVWFFAASLNGPWRVASVVPAAIYGIPSDSPLYFVTFVRIYGSSAGTVYAGYTEGYRGTCVDSHGAVVVYGTGYTYSSWIGTVWHGAPATYGSAAVLRYTPGTDWMFESRLDSPRGVRVTGTTNLYLRWGNSARVTARSAGSHIKNAPEKDSDASQLTDGLYAGDDGTVYRYTAAEWERPGLDGWSRAHPSLEVVRALDAARVARSIGSQRWTDFSRGAFELESPGARSNWQTSSNQVRLERLPR